MLSGASNSQAAASSSLQWNYCCVPGEPLLALGLRPPHQQSSGVGSIQQVGIRCGHSEDYSPSPCTVATGDCDIQQSWAYGVDWILQDGSCVYPGCSPHTPQGVPCGKTHSLHVPAPSMSIWDAAVLAAGTAPSPVVGNLLWTRVQMTLGSPRRLYSPGSFLPFRVRLQTRLLIAYFRQVDRPALLPLPHRRRGWQDTGRTLSQDHTKPLND